ncbi:MAG: Txe/YoeB family addiction module toxin [Cytophagia bacterium]|nr:MAG: Txe/YoeB family addiction module toxin [Runella sp.]TAG16630.1 MAG: Txe/YoeB family addiction module toxin [Cytophagales bacterium]TAG35906.1 MAG: Txe/YoeB family addiction module toxin [Cytophagia bacterium]TAG57425.1 MAG: Txe/YoeB family addiction module toxin [Runella slithyformis]TAG77623.1 MAG: Txe/YoeB family addiction module toxin [Cytophagales bacterium]
MRKTAFTPDAFDHFNEWRDINKDIQDRIIKLIDDTRRNPFQGIGKPEALKYDMKGLWSRRINDEHRLVYQVTEDYILIVSCKYHYTK